MRSSLLGWTFLFIAGMVGCDRSEPPPVMSSTVPQPSDRAVHSGVIEIEWRNAEGTARKTFPIGPSPSTRDYTKVVHDDDPTAAKLEFRFVKHEGGIDHYRFGAFTDESGFEGMGAGEDVTYAGKEEIIVFDQPGYKVRILPPANSDTGAQPHSNK